MLQCGTESFLRKYFYTKIFPTKISLHKNFWIYGTCNKCCDLIGHLEVSISHRDLQVFTCSQGQRRMQSATVALSPGQMPWLQLLYSKSVRDLVQWSLCFLRDPQALSSTLALLGMLKPRAFGSPKLHRDLGLDL